MTLEALFTLMLFEVICLLIEKVKLMFFVS
jgi:hypothetical protein